MWTNFTRKSFYSEYQAKIAEMGLGWVCWARSAYIFRQTFWLNASFWFAVILSVSLISIFGLYISYKNRDSFFKIIIIPFLFLIMCTTFLLQQSSSVHLMGYSYIFSFLFSVGIVNFFFKILEKNNFTVLSILLVAPLATGIILLCIRVSMLTGING